MEPASPEHRRRSCSNVEVPMPQLSLRQPPPQSSTEAVEAELRHAILSKLTYELGKTPDNASDTDWYQATALAVRDRIVDIWMKSRAEAENKKKKRVYYLSIEFLIGRLLLDTPVAGWRGRHVNALRLWSARIAAPIQLATFNKGDYVGAVAARARAEAISRVLYPNDATPEGQELRLRQEYFFTAASLQDIVRRHLDEFGTLESLPDHAAVQLNDTHPAIAVAELMRILVDDHACTWEAAWRITKSTLNYTNHTLLPEALETWPVDLIGRLLPRHLQIINLINWKHLQETTARGMTDAAVVADVSLVHENGDKRVRMAHLAFLGSNTVNGVSALHTELLRTPAFHELAEPTEPRIVST